MKIKCGGSNVPAVAASELPNIIGTKIILHVWLGRYRRELPPFSCRVPPYLGVKFLYLNNLDDLDPFNISGLGGGK